MTIKVYPERIEYTDEQEINGVVTIDGTTFNNEVFQDLNSRLEDFNIFQHGHLFKTSGYIVDPNVTISTRTVTLNRQDVYTRYFDHELGFWEIPSSLSIELNALTSGVAVNRNDYLYLELFKYNNSVDANGELVNGSNAGKIGFRLNVYETTQPVDINTTRSLTTSTRSTELEQDHVIYPLTQITRYQTDTVDETYPLTLTDISEEATINQLSLLKLAVNNILADENGYLGLIGNGIDGYNISRLDFKDVNGSTQANIGMSNSSNRHAYFSVYYGNIILNPTNTSNYNAVLPYNDNASSFGSSDKRWKAGYFESLISPDVKALLNTHDFQYVYDWSALPANSNHKWITASGTGATQSISSGELTISDAGGASSNLVNYRESGAILSTDKVIVEHTGRFVSATVDDVMFAQITDAKDQGGGVYKSIPLLWKGNGTGVIFNSTLVLVDTTVNHTYTIIKDGEHGSYLFIDGVLKLFIAYTDMITRAVTYGGTYNLVFGTSYASSTSTCEYISSSFKYSILREGTNKQINTSSKTVGGNVDVLNQAETSGIQITPERIQSTGTNQNCKLKANGTGEIEAESNLTGLILEGSIQHKYIGTLKTAANYDILPNEGFILTSSSSNVVDLDLPNAGSYLGREIIVNTGNALNSTTITCDGSSNKILGINGTAYDTCTLTGVSKFVRLIATNGIYWQVTSKSETGITFS